MREYPNIKDVDELLSVAFNKGIIPAMQVLGKKGKASRGKKFKSK